jgi:hypothetical protein
MRAGSSIVLLAFLTTGPLAHAKSTLRDQPVTAPSRQGVEPGGLPAPGTPGSVGAPGGGTAPGGTAPAGAASSGGAGALPEVPLIGDEPLPDWKPPEVKLSRRQALFLSLSPEVQRGQRWRQAGLWMSSFGGVALLGGGIAEAYAIEVASSIGTATIHSANGQSKTGQFDPRLEDQKDAIHAGALSVMIVGAALTVGGLTLFGFGQHRIKKWHDAHPADPLPALSGY